MMKIRDIIFESAPIIIGAPQEKAGIIPYYVTPESQVYMNFFISSDPTFGGPEPQIAKGHVDPGETPKQAAIREGEEELGLIRLNLESIVHSETVMLGGLTNEYKFNLFITKVKDPYNFGSLGSEAWGTKWLTMEEFMRVGRTSQLPLVQAAHSKMK